jgi:hypothetical protein
MTEFLPGEKIVGPSLMHEDRREVSGAFVRKFGGVKGFLVDLPNGGRDVIDATEARYLNPRMSDSLRDLADAIDKNARLTEWFSFTSFGRHLAGAEAAQLDEFAEMFGVQVESRVHGPASIEPGAQYTTVTADLGPIELRLQAHTADYEKAKLAAIGPIPPEQLDEAKRVSDWNAEQAGGES